MKIETLHMGQLNSAQNVEECDARDDATCNAVRLI